MINGWAPCPSTDQARMFHMSGGYPHFQSRPSWRASPPLDDHDMDTLAQDDDASDGIQDDRISRNFRASRNGQRRHRTAGGAGYPLAHGSRIGGFLAADSGLARGLSSTMPPRTTSGNFLQPLQDSRPARQSLRVMPLRRSSTASASLVIGLTARDDARCPEHPASARPLSFTKNCHGPCPCDCGGILVTAAPTPPSTWQRSVARSTFSRSSTLRCALDVTHRSIAGGHRTRGPPTGYASGPAIGCHTRIRARSHRWSRARGSESSLPGLPAPDLQVEVRPRNSAPRFLDMGWRTVPGRRRIRRPRRTRRLGRRRSGASQ